MGSSEISMRNRLFKVDIESREDNNKRVFECFSNISNTKGSNVENTRGLLIMLLTSTTLIVRRTIGVERHWSHGTRQKLLGRTIIPARSQDNITFS